ncbi:hypothetical protein [Capsulimonas corticalis]|uniref:hypothetical protein n=1 Tax=Capsulimonas corticalis TaxID=2219043 RepID=UPI000F64DD80|nr:hypothetical protein [Capsulimonas corticalis]
MKPALLLLSSASIALTLSSLATAGNAAGAIHDRTIVSPRIVRIVGPPLSPAPTNLTVSKAGSGHLYLTWQGALGAQFFVKRWTGTSYTTIASTTQSYFTDGNLTDGVSYMYVVSQTINGIPGYNSTSVSQTPGLSSVPNPPGNIGWSNDGPVTVYSDAVPPGPISGNHYKLVKSYIGSALTATHGSSLYFDESCSTPATWEVVIYRPDGSASNVIDPVSAPTTYWNNWIGVPAIPAGYTLKLYFVAYAQQSYPMTNSRFELWW